MKKLLFTLILAAQALAAMAVAPPEGSFQWGRAVPLSLGYRESDTLAVTSPVFTGYSVTYELADTSLSAYIAIAGNRVTVTRNYIGGGMLSDSIGHYHGRVYLHAIITNIPGYDDDTLETYVATHRIDPGLTWNCTVADMQYGQSVQLSATHSNTDSVAMRPTYDAADNNSRPSRCVRFDQQNGTMTAVELGTDIYVLARLDSTLNFHGVETAYPDNNNIVRFNVTRGYRSIRWDISPIDNFAADLPLRPVYGDPQDSVEIVSSDTAVARILPGNVLHVVGPGTVRLTANIAGTPHYFPFTADTTINISAAATTVMWEENVIAGKLRAGIINSTADSVDLSDFAGSNYGDGARYVYSIPAADAARAVIIDDTLLRCYQPGEVELQVRAIALGGTSAVISRRLTIPRGRLAFVRPGRWADRSCWSRADLAPDATTYGVEVLSQCTVPAGSDAVCYDMAIFANGALTIEPGAMLTVTDSLLNYSGNEALTLRGDKTDNAVVKFPYGSPRARVERWMDCRLPSRGDTTWLYVGLPVDKVVLQNYSSRMLINRWSDARGWQNVPPPLYPLSAFEGYRLVDTVPKLYKFDGRLVTDDHTYDLSYTAAAEEDKRGLNLIANSYVVPLPLRTMEMEGANAELFFLQNGRYVPSPCMSASAAGRRAELRSGEAAFVRAVRPGAQARVSYQAALSEVTDDQDFSVLRIAVSGGGAADTVVLVAHPACDSTYDNGYDGTKWFNPESDSLPELYVTTAWGRASVAADHSLVGSRIGFRTPDESTLYTMTFDAGGLRGVEHLYLFDLRTQTYVDVTAGESYAFTGSYYGEAERFTILPDRIEPQRDKNGRGIVVVGDRMLVVGFDGSNIPVRLMNMEGKVIAEYSTADGPWFQLPELVTGVYVVNVDRCSTKFYR